MAHRPLPARPLSRAPVLALAAPALAHAGPPGRTSPGSRRCCPATASRCPARRRCRTRASTTNSSTWTRTSGRCTAPTGSRRSARSCSRRPRRRSRPDRLAWAINAHNFLVIEHATLHLLVPGRQFLRQRSVDEITFEGTPFFAVPVVECEGRTWSIGEFARHYVYGDSTPLSDSRSKGGDPRLSLALCPGYAGGPPLALRAFKGDSLEIQLDQAARRALSLPRFLTVDKTVGTIVASEHFNTNRADFGGNPNSAIPFLERYGSPDVKSVIKKFKLTAISRFRTVDVGMNQFERPKSAPTPMPASGAGT
ncbi:MAG: DUF547 domain-containing protein [Candidatus Eisenbacteria bacterium]|nr:DUF547 domain-containing protein [Candidatus Eisenbacteria bacterium]